MQGIAQLSAGRRWPAMLVVCCALHGCAQSVPVSTASSAGVATGSISAGTGTTPVAGPAQPVASNSGSATLTWVAPTQNTDGSPLTDLAGYHLFYGTSDTPLSQDVVLDGTATTYVVNGLGTGTYYFAVTAFSSQGTESALSSLVSKTF